MKNTKLRKPLFPFRFAQTSILPATTIPAQEQTKAGALQEMQPGVDVVFSLGLSPPALSNWTTSYTRCSGSCDLLTVSPTSSPPDIMACQFLSSGDVGPFFFP